MVQGLLSSAGLGGIGFCQMCNSHCCMHTLGGIGAQQQMASHEIQIMYDQMRNIGSPIPAPPSQSTRAFVHEPETKKPNKLLLLLR